MSTFKDHFSHNSGQYRKYRPGYPNELFQYLSSLCEEKQMAWDVGTGNGQAAIKLSTHFESVYATDASASQIANARQAQNIEYAVCPAERCPRPDAAFDLITVAQAVHWFDFEPFYKEVRRVARPGGIVAVWTYGIVRIDPKIDSIIDHFYYDIISPYWPEERRYVEAAYSNLPFPFTPVDCPVFETHLKYTYKDLMDYLHTWSSVKNYMIKHNDDPLGFIKQQMLEAWGPEMQSYTARWQIITKAGVVN